MRLNEYSRARYGLEITQRVGSCEEATSLHYRSNNRVDYTATLHTNGHEMRSNAYGPA